MRLSLFVLALSCSSSLASPSTIASAPERPQAVHVARAVPTGFVQMWVGGVAPTAMGHTVVLVQPETRTILPFTVGLPEAVSIHARLESRAFSRPMTQDLLENVLSSLGGRLLKVHIDDFHDDVFFSTVFIATKNGVVTVDARPSDAIALALSNRAPILVALPIVHLAGLTPDDLQKSAPQRPHEPPPGVLKL